MDQNDKIKLKKAELALQNVLLSMPHLAGLVESIQLQLEERIPTAGIFASGRLAINPDWFENLSLQEATFVLAHELMHLMLLTHDRIGETDIRVVNIAHDLIINADLEKVLNMPTPAMGLTYKAFLPQFVWDEFKEGMPMEKLVALLEKHSEKGLSFLSAWSAVEARDVGTLGDALQKALGDNPFDGAQSSVGLDVFTLEKELELYPGEVAPKLKQKATQLSKKIFEAISKQEMHERVSSYMGSIRKMQGSDPGRRKYTYEALQAHYNPPWQMAMQQWMEATATGTRTYARPSRRGQYSDLVRPGKDKTGYTLHIVLDTSGSMDSVLPKALAVIGSFCGNMNIETIHILQCDTEITANDWVETSALHNYEIRGFGGSDMSPAMFHLAEDPEVERAIVITDGYISFPQNPMPYEVLWVLTEDRGYVNSRFTPPYGQCIEIEE